MQHKQFTFPAALVKNYGAPSKIVLKPLTFKEEIIASENAGTSQIALAQYLVMAALVSVDGEPVTLGDGSAERFWGEAHPKVRLAIRSAHSKINGITEAEEGGFLESATDVAP